jgi:SNF2 family DNA or RNA helicase
MKTIPGYVPFQFQHASINWHIQSVINNNGSCIFDDTGLGKTITASTVAINVTEEKILVISPAPNRSSWIEVLTAAQADFIVCTSAKIIEGRYGTVIVDEAHNFKSIKSKSYLDLFRIIKHNQAKVLLLTATAFQNRPSELKTMASLIHFHTNTPAFILLGSLFKMVSDGEKTLENQERYVGTMGDAGFSFQDINVLVENENKVKLTLAHLGNIFATFSHRNTREDIENNYSQDVAYKAD